ncbi:MAG: endonuclease/exonuclease/phosphatase family protein [Candidatus Cryptobacteroides sp.]
MKKPSAYSLAVLALLFLPLLRGSCSGRLSVMFWNLENFFDWRADSTVASSSDKEFSSFGSRHWSRSKFQTKCEAIAKTILLVADTEGRLPDLIGVAEVENAFVLDRLLDGTVLRRLDYSFIHFESPDPRGIDVALLYRRSSLKPLSEAALHVPDSSGRILPTRDILLATFTTSGDDTVAILVNHHPSKYGSGSAPKRVAALERLRAATDSLQASGIRNIICMGDFNDTPDNPAFRILTGCRDGAGEPLESLALPLHEKGLGTIKYNGKWDLIDLFFVSKAIARRVGDGMKIPDIPFLTVRDSMYGGEKPYRTFSGPRYIGGVSDHRPVLLSVGEEGPN